MTLRPALRTLLATATLSCGGSNWLATSGMLGEPSTAVISRNLIVVNASMNAVNQSQDSFRMLIDSGSPVVLIDPTLFNTPPPAATAQIPTKIDLGLLDAAGNPVVVIEKAPVLQVLNAMMGGLGFRGILGGNVMRQFSVQLDYSAPMMKGFCLGCSAGARNDVGAETVVPFTLKGGGNARLSLGTDAQGNEIDSPPISIPATRIPVTVTIEGTPHDCLVDTGTTEVSLRSTVYDALVTDGRAQLQGGTAIMTIAGPSYSSLTRAKTITVGTATVDDAPVMRILSNPPDQLLDGISSELGTQIDCLLGGSFLRNFLVTIDYPRGQLHLEPYLTPVIPDEFRRAGFTIDIDPITRNFVVASVYPSTDADTQGITVNDEVMSIDGTPAAGEVAAVDHLLDGTVGTSKMITFGAHTGLPSHANQTLSVMVQDLIPNP